VEQSSDGIRQQQSETDQVATAITEMAASVQEVARNAQNTADAADKADAEARAGRQVVADTGTAIGRLAAEVEKASGVIQQLETRSSEITSVLDVIRGIAEQTNLLALNAAIEAARAGEQGRGFAVVADEVRTLASRTQQSTQEIQSMIEKLQDGARSAVKVMTLSREQADSSVEQARHAAASLENITRSVSVITDMSAQIATAVEEQSAVGEEINRNVVSIRHISDANADTGAQSEQAAQNVAQLALSLQQLATQFWSKRR
jgi:aerotaxis receptor